MLLERLPLSLRLALGHALWMGVLLAGLGHGIYRLVEHNLLETVDASLRASAESIRDARLRRDFGLPLMQQFLEEFFGEKYIQPYAQLVDLSGQIRERTDQIVSLPVSTRALARAEKGLPTLETFGPRHFKGTALRQVTLPVIRYGKFSGELIQVGAPLEATYHTLRQIGLVLSISLPLCVFLSVAFGYHLARRSLVPVTKMSEAAKKLGSEDLSVRLPLPAAQDELWQLAQTFNEMLDRLEDAFSRLRRFTGDVSHELRTPLAVMKGEAELALRRERSPEQYKEALTTIQKEANHMTEIVSDLLLLARAESRAVAMVWQNVDAHKFLDDLAEGVKGIYAKNSIELFIRDHGVKEFSANPGYLSIVLKNLLINAAKHSPNGSKVEMDICCEQGELYFRVTDHGEGISEAAIPYIFDPFYRVDSARNRANGGTGIGLSLALALVRLHGGTISVTSKIGEGSVFKVQIPQLKGEGKVRPALTN